MQIDFPGFEKNADGAVATVTYARGSNRVADEAKAWCEENCRGRWHTRDGLMTFELYRDAALAKLFLC